jgi:hypothetical protein
MKKPRVVEAKEPVFEERAPPSPEEYVFLEEVKPAKSDGS